METGLCGPEGDAQGARNVGQGHAEEVVHDDDGTPFGVEVPERVVEQLAVGDRRRDVAAGWGMDRGQLDFDRPAPPTACDIDAGVDDELAQPGIELVGVAKRRQVSPSADEAVLDRVAGELWVPKDQPGGRVEPGDSRAGERGEGVMIALPRSFD